MKLGVFDSGIGGEAVAASLREHFPGANLTVINDTDHLPYGDKAPELICELTNNAIQPLLGSDIIVIACNSATTAAIDWLREKYPNQKFIGIEPMIKPAALLTKTGVIAVCATQATLASSRYSRLKKNYAENTLVLEPNCTTWAQMIENNKVNEATISEQINDVIEKGADVIVLGCTHYHWIKTLITDIAAGRAQVLEPSTAIAERVKKLLEL